jgi:hypothetical protein
LHAQMGDQNRLIHIHVVDPYLFSFLQCTFNYDYLPAREKGRRPRPDSQSTVEYIR